MGQVECSPSDVNRPSAIVDVFPTGMNFLASNDCLVSSAPAGSAAKTLIAGFRALAACWLLRKKQTTGTYSSVFTCDRTAAEHAPTTHRHDDRVQRLAERIGLLEQLEHERALSGHDVGVLVRVHECRTCAIDNGLGRGLTGLERGDALGNDAAVATHGRLLDLGCVAGHDNVRGDATQTSGQCECLCVVAAAVRHDTACGLISRQVEHGRARPAELERANLLQVLALEHERAARQAVHRRAGQCRRARKISRAA